MASNEPNNWTVFVYIEFFASVPLVLLFFIAHKCTLEQNRT